MKSIARFHGNDGATSAARVLPVRYGMEVISQRQKRHEDKGTKRIPTTMWLVGAVRDRSRGVYGAIRPQP